LLDVGTRRSGKCTRLAFRPTPVAAILRLLRRLRALPIALRLRTLPIATLLIAQLRPRTAPARAIATRSVGPAPTALRTPARPLSLFLRERGDWNQRSCGCDSRQQHPLHRTISGGSGQMPRPCCRNRPLSLSRS
jgi:hypothetical protein